MYELKRNKLIPEKKNKFTFAISDFSKPPLPSLFCSEFPKETF